MNERQSVALEAYDNCTNHYYELSKFALIVTVKCARWPDGIEEAAIPTRKFDPADNYSKDIALRYGCASCPYANVPMRRITTEISEGEDYSKTVVFVPLERQKLDEPKN